MTYYFSHFEVCDVHLADDSQALNLRLAKFHIYSYIPVAVLVRAFGVSRPRVERAVARWHAEGADGFIGHRGWQGRKRTVISEPMAQRARQLLDEGQSIRACAAELGIASSTLHDNIKGGVIRAGESPAASASERGERNSQDLKPAAGRACHDAERRMLTSAGMLEQATPRFERAAHAVQRGGVLLALPMLLKEGLLSSVQGLLKLPAGFYGLTTILLLVAFMTVARVRNPEGLRHQSPGEWGQVLGLDRGPEVKTLRRKLGLLAESPQLVNRWQSQLASQWLASHDDNDWLTLAVDGHVKVYSGRKGQLPKQFVASKKLCMPASVSYWINALDGAPLLCLHKDLNPKMVKVLEHDVVPQLQGLGVLPDPARLASAERPDSPAVTLVFDREGWSPGLFKRLAAHGVACITWHKNHRSEDWPPADFDECELTLQGPVHSRRVKARLAERQLELSNGLQVRQIRRLTDDGQQKPFITTHPSMPMTKVATAMFSRWNQENFFKQLKHDYNLDALAEYAVAEVDPDHKVVNPNYRAIQKVIDRVRKRLGRLYVKAQRKSAARLSTEINETQQELEQLVAERNKHRCKIRVGELPAELKPEALPPARRLFLDLIRMLCYRAETRMLSCMGGELGPKPNARKQLTALLTSDANIIPDLQQRQLRVQLLGSANQAADQACRPLLEALNRTETVYPGTDLTLVYELAS